jgi:hypothetical protein
MNKHSRVEFARELNEDYQTLRKKHNNFVVEMVSLEEAKENKLKLF